MKSKAKEKRQVVRSGVTTCRSREEWLSFRRAFVGASEVAAVLAQSPFAGPYDVWKRKKGEEEEPRETIRMRAGRVLEELILELYKERTGLIPEHNQYEVYYDGNSLICSTPDAFVTTPDGPGLVECKTSSSAFRYQWGPDGSEEVPLYYYLQAVAQIGTVEAATGIKLASYHFAVLFDLHEFCVFSVDLEKARAVYAELAPAIHDWFYTHVVGDVAPDPTPKDAKFKKLISETHQGADDIIPANSHINEIAEEYIRRKEQLHALEEHVASLELQLKKFIGEHAGVATAMGTFTWKQTKDKVVIDYQAIVEHLKVPDDVIAQFTKVQPGVRRFLPPKRRAEN